MSPVVGGLQRDAATDSGTRAPPASASYFPMPANAAGNGPQGPAASSSSVAAAPAMAMPWASSGGPLDAWFAQMQWNSPPLPPAPIPCYPVPQPAGGPYSP